MDSIRENRTKDDILEEIRLEQSADIYGKKCFVITEGSDDVLFIRKMFSRSVICLESFAGKSGLMEIMAEQDAASDSIIGIRDRDYVDETALPDRIFLYDHCCLEMMLLAEQAVTESFYQIYSKGKNSCDTFLLNTMRQLAPYSILRKRNEKESLGISFRKAGFGDLIDFSNESLNCARLFQRTGEAERFHACQQEADELEETALWEMTNGHDICTFLGCLSKTGKKGMDETSVRNILLVSYRKEDFFKTTLRQNILSYQHQKHLEFLEETDQQNPS